MTQKDSWERLAGLFESALDIPAEQRAAWVEQACPDDPGLKDELLGMLAAHDRRGVLDRAAELPTMELEGGPTLPAGTVVGPYEITGELGRGGMGVVYKAEDRRLDRFVALKFLNRRLSADAAARRQFLEEARAASSLDHPNICTVYDVGQAPDGQVFIAMAWCDGETLAARMARGPLPVAASLEIALQVADGLGVAHEKGVVHRDVKPSNVIITRRGVAKILDFGIAQLQRGTEFGAARRAGTVPYAAPEQLRGEVVDQRADVWSLGAVFYEMLSGVRAFGGDNDAETAEAVFLRDPEPVENLRQGVPEPVAAAIRKALRKDPRQRHDSAGAFAAALREWTAHPPPGTETARPAPLPFPLTCFVGRAAEMKRIRSLLRVARLVTLVGPGGTGKTRLALEVAGGIEAEFSDGVCFVALSAVADKEMVAPAILEALGLFRSGIRPAREELTTALAGRRMLIVLDNFEQVIAAAPLVADLLQMAGGLKVLVTSRVPLRLTAEHEVPVPPLEEPETVELFVQRARAVRPDFDLGPDNAGAVAEICRRLDGLPLAIELAAARTRVFPPQAMVARLGKRLDLLKDGERDRPARHQTLRQAMAWSYDLLDEDARRLFRRAGVFAGRFTLEALDAVCEGSTDTLDALCTLVDHSLIAQRDAGGADPRFRLLETVREYALEQLSARQEDEAARRAHAAWFSRVAERAGTALTGREQGLWLRRLDAEHDDVRAAMDWLESRGEVEPALRIAAGIWRYWVMRGQHHEGRARLERLLEQATDAVSAEVRAFALNGCGTLAHGSCDMKSARRMLRHALSLFRECGNRQGVALVLNNLAWVDIELSDFKPARALSEEALELNRETGDRRGLAVALNNLGWIANYVADFDAACSYHQQSIEERRRTGDHRGVAFGLSNLAWTHQRRGHYARALELLDQAEPFLEDVKDPLLDAWAWQLRAAVACDNGDFRRAAALVEQRSLPVWRRLENATGLAFALVYYGLALAGLSETERAAAALEEGRGAARMVPQYWALGMIDLAAARLAGRSGDSVRARWRALRAAARMRRLGDGLCEAEALEVLAEVESGERPDRATGALEAADDIRRRLGVPVAPCRQEAVSLIRRRLGGPVRAIRAES